MRLSQIDEQLEVLLNDKHRFKSEIRKQQVYFKKKKIIFFHELRKKKGKHFFLKNLALFNFFSTLIFSMKCLNRICLAEERFDIGVVVEDCILLSFGCLLGV